MTNAKKRVLGMNVLLWRFYDATQELLDSLNDFGGNPSRDNRDRFREAEEVFMGLERKIMQQKEKTRRREA
jgi:hypothetical protein